MVLLQSHSIPQLDILGLLSKLRLFPLSKILETFVVVSEFL